MKLKHSDLKEALTTATGHGLTISYSQDIETYLGKRAQSSSDILMMKGLNYTFTLKDLHKYSKRLNAHDLTDKFSKTVLGKRVPTLAERVRQLEQVQRKLKEQNYWEYLRNQAILEQMDWAKSRVYQEYKKNGNRVNNNKITEMYSETEC